MGSHGLWNKHFEKQFKLCGAERLSLAWDGPGLAFAFTPVVALDCSPPVSGIDCLPLFNLTNRITDSTVTGQ